MGLVSFKRGQGSIVLRVKIADSTSTSNAGLTGLAHDTASLSVSTIADNEAIATTYSGSNLETIATLGTFAAPTSGKARFKAVDGTNHPGVCEIQLADARYAVSNAKSLIVTIKGAANMVQTDAIIPLVDDDPYVAKPANSSLLSIDGSGRVDAIKIAGTTQTARDLGASVLLSNGNGVGQILLSNGTVTVGGNLDKVDYTIATNGITALSVAASALNGKGDWLLASSYTTPPTAAAIADATWDEARADHTANGTFGQGAASVQGNVTGSTNSVTTGVTVTTNNDKTGYALTAGERTSIATAVESAITNELADIQDGIDTANTVLEKLDTGIEADPENPGYFQATEAWLENGPLLTEPVDANVTKWKGGTPDDLADGKVQASGEFSMDPSDVTDIIDGVVDGLQGATLAYTGPITPSGDAEIYQGGSYIAGELEWTGTWTGPNIHEAEATAYIVDIETYQIKGLAAESVLEVSADIEIDGTDLTVTIPELTSAQSATLFGSPDSEVTHKIIIFADIEASSADESVVALRCDLTVHRTAE